MSRSSPQYSSVLRKTAIFTTVFMPWSNHTLERFTWKAFSVRTHSGWNNGTSNLQIHRSGWRSLSTCLIQSSAALIPGVFSNVSSFPELEENCKVRPGEFPNSDDRRFGRKENGVPRSAPEPGAPPHSLAFSNPPLSRQGGPDAAHRCFCKSP